MYKVNSKRSDYENSKLEESVDHKAEAAAALFIKSKLVGEMGFSVHMVDCLLRYERDIVNSDIQKAIDFCVKTDLGWTHKFIPESNEYFLPTFPNSMMDEEYGCLLQQERCIICGETAREHRVTSSRFLGSVIIEENNYNKNRFDELEEDSEVEFSKIEHNLTSHDSESKESINDNEELKDTININEDVILCSICYCEHNVSKSYSLSCCHPFGISCLRQMLQVAIKDGKVVDNKCAQFDCDVKYQDADIRKIIVDKDLLDKYAKFKENIEVNLDKSKQWCPAANCGLWVKGSHWKPKVECSNGHQFCFICQQKWHSGNCKDHLDEQFMDWASEHNVARCPKCNVRIEKNEGCNHMTCFCGYQWCWLCKGQYSHLSFTMKVPQGTDHGDPRYPLKFCFNCWFPGP